MANSADGAARALATRRSEPELTLRDETTRTEMGMGAPGTSGDLDDLVLIDAAAAPRLTDASDRAAVAAADRLAPQPVTPAIPNDREDDRADLPLFTDDVPLITRASPPRPPLAVRRATPEVPRLRTEAPRAELPRTAPLAFHDAELEMPFDAAVSPAIRAADPEWVPEAPVPQAPATLPRRMVAAVIDLALLAAVDLAVVSLTLQICGLDVRQLQRLPLGPLLAFLVVQNGGYLVAFTAGGQTIGKMLTGIRVVAAEPGESLDLGRSFQRTLAWVFMLLPAGLGLLSALLSPERRGLHDRFAGTKVVRATP